jgi:copper chaperone
MQRVEIKVEGMTCGHCVKAVETRLRSLAGVSAATVDLQGKKATVDYEPGKVDVAQVCAAIDDEGYKATRL